MSLESEREPGRQNTDRGLCANCRLVLDESLNSEAIKYEKILVVLVLSPNVNLVSLLYFIPLQSLYYPSRLSLDQPQIVLPQFPRTWFMKSPYLYRIYKSTVFFVDRLMGLSQQRHKDYFYNVKDTGTPIVFILLSDLNVSLYIVQGLNIYFETQKRNHRTGPNQNYLKSSL